MLRGRTCSGTGEGDGESVGSIWIVGMSRSPIVYDSVDCDLGG